MTDDPLFRPAARREPLSSERFRSPEITDRPGMRWWWQSPVPANELVRELRAIAEAGFGEVEIAFSPGFWADAAQRTAFRAVLEEAERLGVGVASTLGAAWPLQTPNTSTGTEHAAQELQYGVNWIDGASAQRVTLPFPFDDPDGARPSRLVAVTAARVLTEGERPTLVPSALPYGPRNVIHPPAVSTVLSADSLLDLTADVIDGTLAWEPRDGDWAVFAFWTRDSEQGVTSFLDRAAALAATEYLDEHQIGAENSDLLRRVGTELFEDSLELNADSLFWSPELLEKFQDRHGYDPTRYLPVLFAHGMCRYWVPNEEPTPDFDLDSPGIGRRIRQDYYRLITDLYITDHLLLLQEWSVGHGLRHKSQVAYGQNLEPIRSNREFVRRGGRAEGESLNSGDRAPVNRDHPNWRYALDWQRCVVGGAHQGGAVRVSTELGAQFDAAYALTLGDYREMLDKEWAAGITKPYLHGFASQAADAPWPSQSRFADYVADSWNDRHFPEWANWRPLTDYWARGTVVLETGIPRTDVAIYRDGFLTSAARGFGDADFTAPSRLADTDALERAGYSVQFLDPVGLTEDGAVSADGTLFPDGPAYRALLIDERAITPEAAKAIDQAAARGLRVVFAGDLPSADSGFGGVDRSHEVEEALVRILARATATQIDDVSRAAQALQSLGVAPRAAWDGPPLLSQWREAGDRRYAVLYNPMSTRKTVDLSLEGSGAVTELDLVSGDERIVSASVQEGRTTVSLALPALGLRVLQLDLARDPAPSAENASTRFEADIALTDWRLQVRTAEPGGEQTIELDGQGPADWRNVDALAGVSGVGVYTARVTAPTSWTATSAVLNLGGLAGSAVVRVGDRTFGPAYVSGSVLALGDLFGAASTIEIEIEVRTPLRNAVIAAGTSPNLGDKVRSQGLIGPVRLLASSFTPSSD